MLLVPWDPVGPGGVIAVIANLYRQVERDGTYEPILLVSSWPARRPRDVIVEGRRTIHFRTPSPWPSGSVFGFLKWLVASPLFLFDLWRLCRKHRVAVFNVHYPSLGCFGPALLRAVGLYRGRIILSFHGLDLTDARNARGVEASFWRFILRHSDVTVACSAAFAKEVYNFVGHETQVAVVHNGVDVDGLLHREDRGPDPLAHMKGRRYIVALGKIENRKGLDVLLRAFARLRPRHDGLALVLVGNAGDASESLRSLTRELALSDDVFFFDAVPNTRIGWFLARADVVCLPSRSETFGIVLLEAGAFRRPVVATRVGGIPEVIENGTSGLLVEPDEPEALAVAIERVLTDRSLANALGERLFERVESEFTWGRAFSAYKKLADDGVAPRE